MQWYVVSALIVALVAVVFGLQNPTVINVKFLAWQFHGSMALVLLITFSLGFLTSFLLSIAALIKKRVRSGADRPKEP